MSRKKTGRVIKKARKVEAKHCPGTTHRISAFHRIEYNWTDEDKIEIIDEYVSSTCFVKLNSCNKNVSFTLIRFFWFSLTGSIRWIIRYAM